MQAKFEKSESHVKRCQGQFEAAEAKRAQREQEVQRAQELLAQLEGLSPSRAPALHGYGDQIM
eukprot:136071-Pyramimonas_sp.AAC.1